MLTDTLLLHRDAGVGKERNLPFGTACLSCVALIFFVGCASVETSSSPKYHYGQRLPKPEKLLIYDFAVSAEQVQLDDGISADLGRAVTGKDATPKRVLQLQEGRKVASALSESLVTELSKYGILVQRGSGPYPTKGNVYYVRGHFVSINEGNQTQRMVIGFGMGRSIVRAQGEVYRPTPQGPQRIAEFTSEVKSGRKPGMGPMIGVGAAAGTIATSAAISGGLGVMSEASDSLPFSASLEANVQKMAKDLAERAAKRYVREGWLPAAVLK